MLDLQARIRLDEGESGIAVCIQFQQKLESRQALQSGGARHAQRRVDQLLAQCGGQPRRRRHLDQFLPIALQAALAFPQVGNFSNGVANHLYLDMPGPSHQRLDIDIGVAECLHSLGTAARIGGVQFAGAVYLPHAAAAAARDRLDHHGAGRAQRLQESAGFLERRGVVGPRQHRDLALQGETARLSLVAEDFQHLGRGADEAQARLIAATREIRVFAQKAVTRMNGVATGSERDADDLRRIEIGGRARSIETVRCVRLVHVIGVFVVFGEHRMCAHAGLRGAACDADRDFAAVGDE